VPRLRVAIPAFDDWECFSILLRELDQAAAELPMRMAISDIKDGSTVLSETGILDTASSRHIDGLEIVHLSTNLGHQQVIAVGRCVAVEDGECDAVLVMDAEGENYPSAICPTLQAAGDTYDCFVDRRAKRSENPTFRLSCLIYEFLYRLLTGRQIDFGNFCLFSRGYTPRIVCIPYLWSSLYRLAF